MAKAPAPAPAPAPSAWAVAADGAAELMDEDDLLDEEDLKKKEAVKTECAPEQGGKRKACKNCSCGLREMLENGEEVPVKSACGNCGMGDAFRCSGCPYLGKPAFQAGEEPKLDLDAAVETRAVAPVGNGGAVKLGLDDMMDEDF